VPLGSLVGDLDSTSLFLSLVITSVGFGFFLYGRKADRYPQIVAGILLMVYPYFTSGAVATLAVGAVILIGLWAATWWGW
jgi:hypothetical protein